MRSIDYNHSWFRSDIDNFLLFHVINEILDVDCFSFGYQTMFGENRCEILTQQITRHNDSVPLIILQYFEFRSFALETPWKDKSNCVRYYILFCSWKNWWNIDVPDFCADNFRFHIFQIINDLQTGPLYQTIIDKSSVARTICYVLFQYLQKSENQ